MTTYESFDIPENNIEKGGKSILSKFFTKLSKKTSDLPEAEEATPAVKNDIANDVGAKEISLSDQFSPDLIMNRNMSLTKLVKAVKLNISSVRGSTENLAFRNKMSKVYWMPDSLAMKCYNCDEDFTTIRRKHHCRMCGHIFCYRCCTFELPGELWNLNKPQRSCKNCFLSFYNNRSGTRQTGYTKSHGSHKTHSISKPGEIDSSKDNNSGGDLIDGNGGDVSVNKKNHNSTLTEYEENEPMIMSASRKFESSLDLNEIHTEMEIKFPDADIDQFTSYSKPLKRTSSLPKLNINPEGIAANKARRKSEQKLYRNLYKSIFPKMLNSKLSEATISENAYGFRSEMVGNQVPMETILVLWRQIIMKTTEIKEKQTCLMNLQKQTRVLENQFSFPSLESDFDGLDIIVKETEPYDALVSGRSLINWMVDFTKIIQDRYQARAVCQSYLDMQLLTPLFNKEEIFKDDNTLYIIEEISTEMSPKVLTDETETFFPDIELETQQRANALIQKGTSNSVFYYDSVKNKEEESELKTPLPTSSVLPNFKTESLSSFKCNKLDSVLWNKSCEFLEGLLRQELRDYNLSLNWINVILPVCKVISETISTNNPFNKSNNDIRRIVQVKKIPGCQVSDCKIYNAISLTKSTDTLLKKSIKNAKILLIQSSIDYWRNKKLVSMEPLLLQEEEYLKNCILKISKFQPDVVVVEGSVSLLAKEIMEKNGLSFISNIRKEQMDRMAKMLQIEVIDSVDRLGANIKPKLGLCSQVWCQEFRISNYRTKSIIFFKLTNPKLGCTVMVHGQTLSELVRLKYVFRLMLLAFKNAFLEISLMQNFQLRSISSRFLSENSTQSYKNESKSVYLDIITNKCMAMSFNVKYQPPISVLRSVNDPEFQNQLLFLDIIHFQPKDRISDVLKRKQKHIFAELYDRARTDTCRHPLLVEPNIHPLLNTDGVVNNLNEEHQKERCLLYLDFRGNGGRFAHTDPQHLQQMGPLSTINFEKSDLVLKLGFLTRFQKQRWRGVEKKAFQTINDIFNPRVYQKILLLYSVHTPSGICESPIIKYLTYYEYTDRILGNFVTTMLSDDSTLCNNKCEHKPMEHVHRFVHNNGSITISVHNVEPTSYDKAVRESKKNNNDNSVNQNYISIWNWCSRCDKILGMQKLSDEAYRLSLGRFFDLLLNLNGEEIGIVPYQCNHSLQLDVHYYFTITGSRKAMEVKYAPIKMLEFQAPNLCINIEKQKTIVDDKKTAFKALKFKIDHLSQLKTKYNLEIKDKIYNLRTSLKSVEDGELLQFLQMESNTECYSKRIHDLYNILDSIYDSKHDSFDSNLFDVKEEWLYDEINYMWIDISKTIMKWDVKLNDAYEKEEKQDKRTKTATLNPQRDTSPVGEMADGTSTTLLRSSTNVALKSTPNSRDNKTLMDLKIEKSPIKRAQSEDMLEKPITMSGTNSPQITKTQNTDRQSPSFDSSSSSNYVFVKSDRITSSSKVAVSSNEGEPRSEKQPGAGIQPLKKFFTSFFTTFGLKVLEDEIPPEESFLFNDINSELKPVIVSDSSITSAIAFVLSSDVYQKYILDSQKSTLSVETSKPLEVSPMFQRRIFKVKTSTFPIVKNVLIPSEYDDELIYKQNQDVENSSNGAKDTDYSGNKEISVHYFHKSESIDGLSDKCSSGDSELALNEEFDEPPREDVKFELNEEVCEPDGPFTKLNAKLKETSLKKINKYDFEINLVNHKVKCTCRLYHALQFHNLRQKIIRPTELDFIVSLSKCKEWITTGGKSGLRFWKTTDNRFIIKELSKSEFNGFQKFYQKYFDYLTEKLKNKKKCVLAKIVGVYQIDYTNYLTKCNKGAVFLVMENLFYRQQPVRIFDLKGKKHTFEPSVSSTTAAGASTSAGCTGNNSHQFPTVSVKSNESEDINAGAASETSPNYAVMQDKDFTSFIRSHPIYVSWQSQFAMKEVVKQDTDFLSNLPVMDYSLLVGWDPERGVLIIGIIDYLRMFTLDKLVEMHFKKKVLMHGEQPTVIEPSKYQKRFMDALDQYFLVAPCVWDSILLSTGSNGATSNANRNKGGASNSVINAQGLDILTKMSNFVNQNNNSKYGVRRRNHYNQQQSTMIASHLKGNLLREGIYDTNQ